VEEESNVNNNIVKIAVPYFITIVLNIDRAYKIHRRNTNNTDPLFPFLRWN